MDEPSVTSHPGPDAARGDGHGSSDPIRHLLDELASIDPSDLPTIVQRAATALGASSAKMLVVDYGLSSLQELGPRGARHALEGTMAGRCFTTGEIVVAEDDDQAHVWIVLAEGSERLGVLELTHPAWSEEVLELVAPVVRVLVLELISKRRYTDIILRSRRARPLSLAAEMQWDLLPPLTCAAERVSVSGILEPAYEIGGDSFDFALNPDRLELSVVDAVGHGMSAVLMAVATINSLRNARREGSGLEAAYLQADEVIERQFGESYFVTGQIASLDLETGELSWINAGHPRPLLVRDGSFVGELDCRPSLPMGLGGHLQDLAVESLQPGDRVLFFTDGVIENRDPAGEQFGVHRLSDLLVRATLDQRSSAETVRRLSASVLAFNSAGVGDDATFLLVDYHG